MPKDLGTQVLNLTLVRSISNFTVSVGLTASEDTLHVQPMIERRDTATDELVETIPAQAERFTEAEMRAILDAGTITELPDYDTLRLGMAKLQHALLDTRA